MTFALKKRSAFIYVFASTYINIIAEKYKDKTVMSLTENINFCPEYTKLVVKE